MLIVFSVYSVTLSLQPFALSVNEKEVVKNLTDELFHVIPPSNDHYITDITDSAGRSCTLMFSTYPVINGRAQYYCQPSSGLYNEFKLIFGCFIKLLGKMLAIF